VSQQAWKRTTSAARAELERLAALTGLDVLNTPPEPEFDRIVKLAAKLFNVPIALISLVDADRQWFKAAVGLEVRETPRCFAFCDWAIRSPEVFVVLDARRDRRFASNPLVTDKPNVVFYAGAPLVLGQGEEIGTLCIIDHEPRAEFDAEARAILTDLAAFAVTALTLRHYRLQDREAASWRSDDPSATDASNGNTR
jgi:GAF domain-containing protein